MAKLTADTITDEQIRELHDEAWLLYATCCYALGFSPLDGSRYTNADDKRRHRYECAKILNARNGAK